LLCLNSRSLGRALLKVIVSIDILDTAVLSLERGDRLYLIRLA